MTIVNLHEIFGVSVDKASEIVLYAINTRQHKTETRTIDQLLEWVNSYEGEERDLAMWCAGAVYGVSELSQGGIP